MAYVYKTQANINRSDINIPELNYDFKTITLPDFMTEQCLRASPKGRCTKKGARRTTFSDTCQMLALYLSGVKSVEISRILGKSLPVVHKNIRLTSVGVNRKAMHKENRLRNMLGKELAKVEEYLYD
jgi:hypothetical protein